MRSSLSAVITVTALSSLSKPMRRSETSLSTIMSSPLRASFARALTIASCVSAANPTTNGRRLRFDDRGDDVGVLDELERQPGASALLDLLRLRVRGSIVGDGGNADEDVACVGSAAMASCICCAVMMSMRVTPAGVGSATGPVIERDARARIAGGASEREALLAGTVVADVAHRVDRLACRSGGDRRRASGERCGANTCVEVLRTALGFEHPSWTELAARLRPVVGAPDPYAVTLEPCRDCVASPRCATSDGSSPGRGRSGTSRRGKASSADRRRGRSRAAREHARSPVRRRCSRPTARVRCVPSRLRRPRAHRSSRTGRPETACNVVAVTNWLCAARHHDLHVCAERGQLSHELGRLVRSDPAGDPQ